MVGDASSTARRLPTVRDLRSRSQPWRPEEHLIIGLRLALSTNQALSI
jgi:hypothetical protein